MTRIFVTLAVLGLAFIARSGIAADATAQGESKTISGVLIDVKCGKDKEGKFKTEQAAAGHPAACAIKCAKGGEPIVLLSGDKAYKLDEKGLTLAKEHLGKEGAKTKVQVMGTVKEDTIAVTAIKPAEEKKS